MTPFVTVTLGQGTRTARTLVRMSRRRRTSALFRIYSSGAVLSMGLLAVSLLARSPVGVLIAFAFSAVFGIVLIGEAVLARRRGELPPHLAGLEPDQRRLVSATVNSGAACPDPRLAGAVVTEARLKLRATTALMLSALIAIGLRIASLQSSRGVERILDVIFLVFFVFVTTYAVPALVRAKRAATLNAS